MGWMHDTLSYVGKDPIYRGYHHNQMTFSLMYAFSENFVLPISHDEVVHGKGSLWERMPGDPWNKAAGVRALLAYMWAHPGKQLLFMGGEFGQAREWSEERSLDWELLGNPLHGGIKAMVGDLNRAYKDHPALWTRDNTPEGFSWIDANDASGNVLSFLRHGVDADGRPTVLACVANFSGGPREDYRVGLPFAGRWREVLNTDAEIYGGSGVGNLGVVEAEPQMWHGRPASAALRLPPSGVLWLAPERPVSDVLGQEEAADIGQATPVAPFAPEVVGDTTPAVVVPDSLADMPEWTSGDGAIDDRTKGGDVDLVHPAHHDAPAPSAGVPEWSSGDGAIDDRTSGGDVDLAYVADDDAPPPVATDTDIDAGPVPSATDADAPHFPDEAPDDAVARHAEVIDSAGSAGVSADAPVVAPEVPEVEVAALGTVSDSWEADQVPPDAAAEDEPPALELTPGAAEAVLDEPRGDSDVTETSVAVGGSAEAATPSATRPADPDAPERDDSARDDSARDDSARDDESSTHQ
jgi:1,4-alpha-glucan branching enzyme